MHLTLWAYFVLYVLVSLAMVLAEQLSPDMEHPSSFWEKVLDVLLLLVGGFGILLFMQVVDKQNLKSVWQWVAPILAGTHLIFLARDWRHFTRKNLHGKEPETFWPTLMLTLVVVGPAVVLNFLYAFS